MSSWSRATRTPSLPKAVREMVRPGPQARDSDDAEASEEEDGSGEEEEGEEDGGT